MLISTSTGVRVDWPLVDPSYHYIRNQGFVRSVGLVELEPLGLPDLVVTRCPGALFLTRTGRGSNPPWPVLGPMFSVKRGPTAPALVELQWIEMAQTPRGAVDMESEHLGGNVPASSTTARRAHCPRSDRGTSSKQEPFVFLSQICELHR